MRLLLDTHILLWALGEPKKLSRQTRARLEDPEVEVLFSAASIWEIAIKAQLNRASFAVRPAEVADAAVASGFTELPVRAEAAALVARLPMHHRDPFDRLLIAQAMAEPAKFCTVDGALAPYSNLASFL
ncbi:MAG: hypothetical protein FD126_1270 [Elusimicrobia bacterium]|nr:MAG: hypothetical protein FD126_1270 [Elusimicrobiota bacterium]